MTSFESTSTTLAIELKATDSVLDENDCLDMKMLKEIKSSSQTAAINKSMSSFATASLSEGSTSSTPMEDSSSITEEESAPPAAVTSEPKTPTSLKSGVIHHHRRSSSSPKSVGSAASGVSKLDLLRARNQHLRRCNSQRIEQIRRSLQQSPLTGNSSTASERRLWMHQMDGHFGWRSCGNLPSTPVSSYWQQHERFSSSAPHLQWDESTLGSATMAESLPPPPFNNSCSSLPLQEVVTSPGFETPSMILQRRLSCPTLETLHSDPTVQNLQEENDMLKRQILLLKQQKEWSRHLEEEHKAVKSLRQEVQIKLQKRQEQWKKRSLRKTLLSVTLAAVLMAVAMAVSSPTSMSLQDFVALHQRMFAARGAVRTPDHGSNKHKKRRINFVRRLWINMKHDTLGVWLKNRRHHDEM